MNTAAQTEAPAVVAVGKKKVITSGNLIADIAAEVESMTKTKALNTAERLAEDIDTNYFRLGGVLKLISENSWFEGFADFDTYVSEKFGFEWRKARYLIAIYTDLVTKQIPWEKVAHLGWTKLTILAPILTLDNVDDWVAKATPLSMSNLKAVIKGNGNGTSEGSVSTSTDVSKLTVKGIKQDQLEVIQTALAKAKGEIPTEYDNVALENICAGYVAGNIGAKQSLEQSLEQVMNTAGWEAVFNAIDKLWPAIKVSVEIPDSMTKK